MSNWNEEVLEKIRNSDDLHISPFRADGKTYGTPTWIWSVVVDDCLYVRAYHGQNSRWYQSAISQNAGRIHVAGMQKEVSFEKADDASNEKIDAAYRAKYAGSPYLGSMISDRARAATIRICPITEDG